jgi:hypothetical protein
MEINFISMEPTATGDQSCMKYLVAVLYLGTYLHTQHRRKWHHPTGPASLLLITWKDTFHVRW